MGELTIEGERFLGRFRASRRTDKLSAGSEYAAHDYDGYWYEGTGIIEDKVNGEKYLFALKTGSFGDYHEKYTLEESIIHFNQNGPFFAGDFKPEIVNGMYKKVVDLGLAEMVSKVKDSKDNIPEISPKRLKVDDLVKMGYCVAENGQINLALSR